MFRITIHNEATITRFIIEGRLVGPWVEELRKCWQSIAHAEAGRSLLPLLVDLSAMTLIDSDGKALLTEMHREGVRFAVSGLLTQVIIEDITR